nr:type-F conjugative transfer system pilin assembly protein TrbC [Sphingomonas xinjiangensis]
MIVLAALATGAGIQAVAQDMQDLDLEAIKRRSAAMEADAQAFAEHVRNRGEAFREEAVQMRDKLPETLRQVAKADLPTGPDGPIDFNEIIKGAGANGTASRGEAPQLIAFASLSMPPASLRQLIADVTKAGGIVVFRGFPNNSLKEFSARMTQVVGQGDKLSGVGIDPRLFRAFDIKAVPAYVAVSSDFDLCSGFSCKNQLPPFDRMTGNVTTRYALETFSEGRGPGAAVSKIALNNLVKAGS